MKPLISVIIPVYNTKDYLIEAINSIIIQKDFVEEIIIINDGSNDGSKELLDNLYSRYEFVKIIHSQNQGQGIARNIGTQTAKSDFIYYFDSDDISVQGLFEKFSATITLIPDLELLCFSAEPFLDPNTSIENIFSKVELSKDTFLRNTNEVCGSGEDAFNLLHKKRSFSPVPYLYIFKKSIILQNNILFRSIRYEDEEFTQKLFLYAKKTYISNEIFCKRRVRSTSVMQLSRSYKDLDGYIKTIETMDELVKLKFIKEETRQNLIRRIFEFIRIIIIIKSTNKINFTKKQKKEFLTKIKPLIKRDNKLAFLYYTYPTEYKLRIYKALFLNNFLYKKNKFR